MFRLINYAQFTLCSTRKDALRLNCVPCLIPVLRGKRIMVEEGSSSGWFLLGALSSVFELIILSECAQKNISCMKVNKTYQCNTLGALSRTSARRRF